MTELREETGLIARESDLVPFASLSEPSVHTLDYPNGDRVHAFALCFVVHQWSGTLSAEAEEVAGFTWTALDRLPTPMHRPTSEVIGLYQTFGQTGTFQAI